jgi:hypothetical protein
VINYTRRTVVCYFVIKVLMPVNILSVNKKDSCSIISQLQCPGETWEQGPTDIVYFVDDNQPREIERLDFHDTHLRGEKRTQVPHLIHQIVKFREPVQHVFWCEFVFCEHSTKPQTFPFSSSTFSSNECACDDYYLVSRRFIGLVCKESLFLLGDLNDHEIRLGFIPKHCINFKLKYPHQHTTRSIHDQGFLLTSGVLIVRNQQESAMNTCSMNEKTPSYQHFMFYLTHPLDPIRPIFLLSDDGIDIQGIPQSFEYLQSCQDIIVMLDITISALRFFQFRLHEKTSNHQAHQRQAHEESRELLGNMISPNYKPSKSFFDSISKIPTRSPLLDHHAKAKIASPSPKYSRFKQSQPFHVGNHQPHFTDIPPIPSRWQSIVLKPIPVSIDIDDHAFTYDPVYCHERPVNVEFTCEKDNRRPSVILRVGKAQVRHLYLNV